jgi:RNA polymerase sigma-70 factor (ECF subfamily)
MCHPGNDERFAELLRMHHTQLFGYLYALVHNANDAEDIYQETCMVLWEKFGEFQEGTHFFSWAVTIARYKVLNFLRVRKRRWQFSEELRLQLGDAFAELDTNLLQSRLEALQECKERLSKDELQLLDACYGSELSFREIANRLRRSPKSVYRVLDRIRVGLMKCIEGRLRDTDHVDFMQGTDL